MKNTNAVSRDGKLFFPIFLACILFLPLAQADCTLETSYQRGGASTQITLLNKSEDTVKVFWLQSNGQRNEQVGTRSLRPGASWTHPSYVNDRWVVTDSRGICLKVLVSMTNSQFELGAGGEDEDVEEDDEENVVVHPSCQDEGPYSRGGSAAEITIVNQTQQWLALHWVNEGGSRIAYGGIEPGESYVRSTYVRDRWLVSTADGQCLRLINSEAGRVYSIGSSTDEDGEDENEGSGEDENGGGGSVEIGCANGINAYPSAWPNANYYKRLCLSGTGIPIVSANYAKAEALERTAFVLDNLMVTVDSAVMPMMTSKGFRHAVMGRPDVERTTMLPEYSHLDSDYWDERARGFGGMPSNPLGSSTEENVLCQRDDRYLGEDITIHEFAHSLHLLGLNFTVSGFDSDLQLAYNSAKTNGLWPRNHYALTDHKEYWAEGVQSYFNGNRSPGPRNRNELYRADPELYNLIRSVFGDSTFSSQGPREKL